MVSDGEAAVKCPGCSTLVAAADSIQPQEAEVPAAGPSPSAFDSEAASRPSILDDPPSPEAESPSPEPAVEQSPPTPAPADHLDEPSWNLGRPMHQVFWLAIVKPDVVPMVTLFRSLRWVMAFGLITSMMLFIAQVGLQQQISPIQGEQEALLKVYDEVVNRSPEDRRLLSAQRWLCDLTSITAEQRLACALSDLSYGRQNPELARRREALKQLRMLRLDAPAFWGILLWIGGPILFFFRIIPLGLVLSLCGFKKSWELATQVIAYVTPAMVIATTLAWAGTWLTGTTDQSSTFVAVLLGLRNVWAWTLTALFLLRMRPSAHGRITRVIILYILLEMLPACIGLGGS